MNKCKSIAVTVHQYGNNGEILHDAGKLQWKKVSLSLCLNVDSVTDDVISDRRLFQVFAAATQNARSLTVRRRVCGSWFQSWQTRILRLTNSWMSSIAIVGGCKSARCSCRRYGLSCTAACGPRQVEICDNPNITQEVDTEEEEEDDTQNWTCMELILWRKVFLHADSGQLNDMNLIS